MQSVSLDTIAEQAETIESELRAGHTLQLLQGGKRIAEIVPATPQPTEAERVKARRALLALLDAGLDLGGRPLTYEERND